MRICYAIVQLCYNAGMASLYKKVLFAKHIIRDHVIYCLGTGCVSIIGANIVGRKAD